jgi:FtsZ-binding cell division protein ZapB
MNNSGPEGPEPLPERGPEPIRYSVAAAAQQLGISDRAVRKRIQAGTLRAEPHGRTYWVYLEPGPEGPEPGPVPLDRNGPEPRPDRALSAERETAVVNLVQQMIEPFVKELGETKEQLGRMTAERDQARIQAEMAALEREQIQAERDALQARLSALETQRAESPATTLPTPETATRRAWWAFWRR